MLVLSPEEANTVRETVKALAEEKNTLKRRLEKCEAALHLLRIENDQLRKEALRVTRQAK